MLVHNFELVPDEVSVEIPRLRRRDEAARPGVASPGSPRRALSVSGPSFDIPCGLTSVRHSLIRWQLSRSSAARVTGDYVASTHRLTAQLRSRSFNRRDINRSAIGRASLWKLESIESSDYGNSIAGSVSNSARGRHSRVFFCGSGGCEFCIASTRCRNRMIGNSSTTTTIFRTQTYRFHFICSLFHVIIWHIYISTK